MHSDEQIKDSKDKGQHLTNVDKFQLALRAHLAAENSPERKQAEDLLKDNSPGAKSSANPVPKPKVTTANDDKTFLQKIISYKLCK